MKQAMQASGAPSKREAVALGLITLVQLRSKGITVRKTIDGVIAQETGFSWAS